MSAATSNQVARAVRRREVRAWFGNPASYVFVTFFVLLSAIALFNDTFFRENQATFDTWNSWFPFLLVLFAPLVTMGLWANERRSGTEELLLTLPASDWAVVKGKYLAAIQIYTVTLLFTLPLVGVLMALGSPDLLLLLGNYVAFWMLGIALLGAGLVGSQLSDNMTVAFILGLVLSFLVVALEFVVRFAVGETGGGAWAGYLPVSLFEAAGTGAFSLATIIVCLGLTTAFAYLNLMLLARRHWTKAEARRVTQRVLLAAVAVIAWFVLARIAESDGGMAAWWSWVGPLILTIGGVIAFLPWGGADLQRESWHGTVRFAALIVATVGFTVGIGQAGFVVDTTAEGIHSLSADTERLIGELDAERPVTVEAFVSTEVPAEYVKTRRDLVNLLRRYDQLGGDAVRVRIVDVEPYSEEAELAEEKFDITPRQVVSEEEFGVRAYDVHLGIAFTCGNEQSVIPFLYAKLPVEYELTRSIRSVAQLERKKLGILQTEVDLFGGFDMQSMGRRPDWEVLDELRYQYEVVRVPSGEDYPEDLDALLAPMPSTLSQEDLDRFEGWLLAGNRALILDDPAPYEAPGMEPSTREVRSQGNPMMGGGPPPRPKGDVQAMLEKIGVRWNFDQVLADVYNPYPEYNDMFAPEMVIVGPNSGARAPFHPSDPAVSGLQELLSFFGGAIESAENSRVTFTPLVTSSPKSGSLTFRELFPNPRFGGPDPYRVYRPAPEQVVAARVKGQAEGEGAAPFEAIFVADIDLISRTFFSLRRAAGTRAPDFKFDNIPFILNCVDTLVGDESFVALRKRRATHRTLEVIEREDVRFQSEWSDKKAEAEKEADAAIEAAQARLDEAVKAVREDASLDATSREIRIRSIEDAENRRLEVARARIEGDKERRIRDARADRTQAQRALRRSWQWVGYLISPLLAIICGLTVLGLRMQRERAGVPATRRRVDDKGGADR